ncbi:DUF5134 domain-containing protein [Streptomyces ficellus]|uniref:DUF5134 domain-containing protein n=1 Tax=Streptomyces ficellus TaxID=1977088 RepID=A0A6I6FD31_9ACTN|nr:DUF5134 domain-containing protein [Streptomyces ficellus]QGV81903.1 DUF5134 domain-containing protein [Streptomyces ficellus]
MHGPAMSGWLLVALCGAAGAFCLARTASSTGAERRAAADEAVMGFGMAAMALPAAVLAPTGWTWAVFAAVFGASSLRALWAARRGAGHHLHHLVGSLAMVYMAVAMASGGGGAHAAHAAPGGVAPVTAVLLVYYAAYVLRAGLRLVPAGPVPVPDPGGRAAGPEVVPACRVSMGLAMLAMLAAM